MNNGNKGSGNRAILPATGGLSGGMPHHNEYRDKIIVCLSKNNAYNVHFRLAENVRKLKVVVRHIKCERNFKFVKVVLWARTSIG